MSTSVFDERIPEITDPGDLITLGEYSDCVSNKYLIDYDGHGYASDGKFYSRKYRVIPSKFPNDIPPGTTHIVWYNR